MTITGCQAVVKHINKEELSVLYCVYRVLTYTVLLDCCLNACILISSSYMTIVCILFKMLACAGLSLGPFFENLCRHAKIFLGFPCKFDRNKPWRLFSIENVVKNYHENYSRELMVLKNLISGSPARDVCNSLNVNIHTSSCWNNFIARIFSTGLSVLADFYGMFDSRIMHVHFR